MIPSKIPQILIKYQSTCSREFFYLRWEIIFILRKNIKKYVSYQKANLKLIQNMPKLDKIKYQIYHKIKSL